MQPDLNFQHDLEERVAGFLHLTDSCNDAQPVAEANLVRRSALLLMRAWRMPALIAEVRNITEESAESRYEEYTDGVDRASIRGSLRRFFLRAGLLRRRARSIRRARHGLHRNRARWAD